MVAVLVQAPIMAIKPTGEEVVLAEVVTPPPAQVEVALATPAISKLPDTASNLPMIALFGLLALGGALAMGFRKRSV
jgi:LPXTG-motif cell wall-anchored protein